MKGLLQAGAAVTHQAAHERDRHGRESVAEDEEEGEPEALLLLPERLNHDALLKSIRRSKDAPGPPVSRRRALSDRCGPLADDFWGQRLPLTFTRHGMRRMGALTWRTP